MQIRCLQVLWALGAALAVNGLEDMHEIRAARIMPHKASDHCLKIWQRSAVPRYSAVIINEYLYRRGAVVYADPPYNNTTGYNNEKFNSTEFWQVMRLLADTGHTVYISEQTAPPDFVCVWEKPFTRTLDRNKGNQFKVTEKLFTYISPIWRQDNGKQTHGCGPASNAGVASIPQNTGYTNPHY